MPKGRNNPFSNLLYYTLFSLVLGGGFEPDTLGSTTVSPCLTVQQNSEQLLQWYKAMEEIPGENSSLSVEDQNAVRHFEDTHFREVDGHYAVGLPFKYSPLQLDKSYCRGISQMKDP